MQAPENAVGRLLRPQRILMLAPCPYPSALGTAVYIRALAYALAADGHVVHIVTYASAHRSGVFHDGPTTCHAVPCAIVLPHSGPQRAKWRADAHLWRYARALAQTRAFDVLYGHHVEGIALGRVLRRALRLPLIGHLHTRLGLELPTYLRGGLLRAAGALAGLLVDRTLPRMVDALVTLNATDALVCRRYGPAHGVFLRYPHALAPFGPTPRRKATGSFEFPAEGYAIYSGNADRYQNLALLCDAAKQYHWPLVVATHGPTLPLAAYAWPASTRIVRVESFAQMRSWLNAAHVGVCPRVQGCGYPIKWLNYWQAGLSLVATEAAGQSVFGTARNTDVHGPTIWALAGKSAFGHAISRAIAQPRHKIWLGSSPAHSFDEIFVAAKKRYSTALY